MKTNIHLWSHLAEFFLEWEMLGQKLDRKSKHTFYINSLFFRIVPFITKSGKLLYIRAGQRRQYGACALHAGYRRLQTHTHGMCNTYCLSTATKFTRKCHDVTLQIHYQSWFQRNLVVSVAVREPYTNQKLQLHTYQVGTEQV